MRARFHFGFTLIELLVVIAIIAILAGILFPVFVAARGAALKAKCVTQARELGHACLLYADDNNGRFVPAASDIRDTGGGLHRWHGVRPSFDKDFDPSKGPLWVYMNRSKGLKECPLHTDLATLKKTSAAFESGGGGFGYNGVCVGGLNGDQTNGSTISMIARPPRTVMFADTAMPVVTESQETLNLEYSFCEPPYRVQSKIVGGVPVMLVSSTHTSPSIHFRHNGRANVVWCDGHVTSEKMSFTTATNAYYADNRNQNVGWFGPDDDSLFDYN